LHVAFTVFTAKVVANLSLARLRIYATTGRQNTENIGRAKLGLISLYTCNNDQVSKCFSAKPRYSIKLSLSTALNSDKPLIFDVIGLIGF